MNLTATVLLAFGMSMDAFAASIGKGATLHKPKFSEALRTGLIFGAVETLTPFVVVLPYLVRIRDREQIATEQGHHWKSLLSSVTDSTVT